MFCVPEVNKPDAVAVGGVTVGVGPGDADAGGAATVVKITGTDHATPAITLRRLKPFSSPLVIFSFKTSDKCAPGVVSAAHGP
jgi:hypothetical protein